MITEPYTITDNLQELLDVLPEDLKETVPPAARADLIEIVLDLGRKPEARFSGRYEYLRETPITREELDGVEAKLGAFGDDNRAGLPATLHRISAIRNRRGQVVGLTLRVGRAVMGIVDILRDLIESGDSLLLMGRPGLGKTTLLREMARVLADEVQKRVVIVDTSNEIAGDGDVPHPAIGRARRMQVAKVQQQHDVMIEAVENHMPEVVVIDEIGRTEETLAARTIAERGVQLIATVHGNTLDNLLANPTMSDLVGGIQAVTLSDEEARRRRTQKTVLERKAPPTFDVMIEMIERDKIAVRRPIAEVVDGLLRGFPTPSEVRWRDAEGNIHVEQAATSEAAEREERDFRMRGEHGARKYSTRAENGRRERDNRDNRTRESRERDGRALDFHERDTRSASGPTFGSVPSGNGSSPASSLSGGSSTRDTDNDEDETWPDTRQNGDLPDTENGDEEDEPSSLLTDAPFDVSRVRRIYPFGVSRSRLARAIKHLGLQLAVVRSWQDADAVLMLSGKGGLGPDTTLLREARDLGLPIIGVRGNTYGQILGRLNQLFNEAEGKGSSRELALQEARLAAQRVMAEAEVVELRPQAKPQRRLQHQIAERFHLRSYSVGREPNRRVRFLPGPGR